MNGARIPILKVGRVLIVPGRFGLRPVLFEVAGCLGFEVSASRSRVEAA